MSPEIWAVIIQTVILVVTFVAYMVRREHRITKAEGRIDSLEEAVKPVPGMSRALARIEGRHREIDTQKVSRK